MLTFKTRTLPRALACGLALTMLCPPASGLLSVAQAQAPSMESSMPGRMTTIQSILIFPFTNNVAATANTGGTSIDGVSARLEDAIKFRLSVINRFRPTSYSPTLSSVQRGLGEPKGLTQDDITPPFDDPQKTNHIATQVATDGYLIGSIEALASDPATRKVTLTVSAALYNTQTGAAVKTLAFSGTGISYNAKDNPDLVLQAAIDDVAGKIVSALNTLPSDRAAVPILASQRGRSGISGSTVLIGLLIAAAIYGFSHHGGGGSSSSTGPTTTAPTPTDSGGPPAPPTVR